MTCFLWDSWCVPAPPSFQWAAQASEAHYRAAETTSGSTLDREQGELRGGQLEIKGEAGWTSGWAEVDSMAGKPAYQGQTQIGIPLSTQTRLSLTDIRFAAGPAAISLSAGDRVWLQVGMQQVRIGRNILATPQTGALEETLQSRSWLVRSEWQHAFAGHPALRLDGSAHYASPQSQSLQVNTFGVFDPLVLHPASGHEWAVDGGFSYEFPAGWRLRWGASYTQMRFGSSAAQLATRGGIPAAVASYPGSQQSVARIGLTVSHPI
jgi:hypothetical protein